MSYYSWLAYLPSLSLLFPTLSIPSQIQNRLLSFFIRRTIGHLLKRGGIELDKLDAQVGRGWVEVREVELEEDAINSLLPGLPLSLTSSHLGSLSLSLPNILTSPISLSLSGLSLSFVLAPASSGQVAETPELGKSVHELVGEVMGDEDGEDLRRDLRASMYGAASDFRPSPHTAPGTSPPFHDHEPPGSINPFLSDLEPSASVYAASPDSPSTAADPPALSLLTSLLARLVSRFTLNLTDVTLRILDPREGCEWVLTLKEGGYEGVEREAEGEAGGRFWLGEVRVQIDGLKEPGAQDLREGEETPLARTIEPDESLYASALDTFSQSSSSVGPPPASMSCSFPLLHVRSLEAQVSTSLLPPTSAYPPTTSVAIELPNVMTILTPQTLRSIISIADQVSSAATATAANPAKVPPTAPQAPALQASFKLGSLNFFVSPSTSISSIDSFGSSSFRPPAAHIYVFADTLQATYAASATLGQAMLSTSPPSQYGAPSSASQTRRTSYTSPRSRTQRSTQLSKRTLEATLLDLVIRWQPSTRIAHHDQSYDLLSFPLSLSDPYPSSKTLFPAFSPPPWSHSVAGRSENPVLKIRHDFASEGGGDAVGDVTTVDLTPTDVKLGLEVAQALMPFTAALEQCVAVGDEPTPDMQVKKETTKSTKKPSAIKRGLIDDLEDEPDHALPAPALVLTIALLRTSVRPPLPLTEASSRSGVFVIDLHSLRFVSGDSESGNETARRLGKRAGKGVKGVVECSRLVAAFWSAPDGKATAFLSVTPLLAVSASPMDQSPPLLPRVSLFKSEVSSTGPAEVDANIPQVQIQLGKKLLDALQLWADDVGKWASSLPTPPSSSADASRVHAAAVSGGGMGAHAMVSEVSIKLLIPRGDGESRPLELTLSDVDVVAEVKSSEKHEMVLSVSALDVGMSDVTPKGPVTLLAQTTPRSLATPSRPTLHLQLVSATNAETGFKQNTVKVTTYGFTLSVLPDLGFVTDLGRFFQAPAGAFEDAVPTEKAFIAAQILSGSIRVLAPSYAGSVVLAIGDLNLSTALIANSPTSAADISARGIHLLIVDDAVAAREAVKGRDHRGGVVPGVEFWKREGYAVLAEVGELETTIRSGATDARPNTEVTVGRIIVAVHACADTMAAMAAFVSDMASLDAKPSAPQQPHPNTVTAPETKKAKGKGLMSSVEEDTFRQAPEVGSTPDMMKDDLPSNIDYLGTSFPPRKGFKVLDPSGEDEDDFDEIESPVEFTSLQADVISNISGETIKILEPTGIRVIEDYFDVARANDLAKPSVELADSRIRVRVRDCDATFNMHDGFDWVKTRRAIEEEIKAVRRRLAKIRQLLATGQTPDESIEEASAMLFNSIYIGLPPEADELEPGALIAAIDEELNDINDTASQASSWQSLPHQQQSSRAQMRASRGRGRRLTRSTGSRIQFVLTGLSLEYDTMGPIDPLASRILVTARNFEILDHIKTSSWKKFLTEMRTDFRGNVRETGANMVRVELRNVRPVPSVPSQEARLRAKLLPLKLHVDQDALDFMKRFFMFENPHTTTSTSMAPPAEEAFIQYAEIFPIDIKLDYKPKRVDYKALRDGRTIELMNFFHWDGAEMTLRHITLSGVSGWARLGDLLNDLWTPDVKANQLADVISGVAPIRSVVNVGSGVADLVLLPIAQYRKDQRIVRGMQRGAAAFVKSTAMEALKVGAQLATGTQVILEQAEHVLGGDFRDTVTTEAVQDTRALDRGVDVSDEDDEGPDLISKYAEQPQDFREGVQAAYNSLSKNFNSAAQTILAVPMEVYERSNNEGPVRAVVRAVPIAVLKPMIGASEAVSKTLFGLRNSIDPDKRRENDEKYKRR